MRHRRTDAPRQHPLCIAGVWRNLNVGGFRGAPRRERAGASGSPARHALRRDPQLGPASRRGRYEEDAGLRVRRGRAAIRSEEHTSDLQSLMRISYAVFCSKAKTKNTMYNSMNSQYIIISSTQFI